MIRQDAIVGTRIRTLRAFSGIPLRSEGVIDEDYGTGIMVAWDLPHHPLPRGYSQYDGVPLVVSGIRRDGFSFDELVFLEIVSAERSFPA
jgi:hypothetical protein